MSKPIQVYLDDDLSRKVRKKLIDEDKKISDLIRELLEKYVEGSSEK